MTIPSFGGSSVAFLPLQNMTQDFQTIIETASLTNISSLPPPRHRPHPPRRLLRPDRPAPRPIRLPARRRRRSRLGGLRLRLRRPDPPSEPRHHLHQHHGSARTAALRLWHLLAPFGPRNRRESVEESPRLDRVPAHASPRPCRDTTRDFCVRK